MVIAIARSTWSVFRLRVCDGFFSSVLFNGSADASACVAHCKLIVQQSNNQENFYYLPIHKYELCRTTAATTSTVTGNGKCQ